MAYYIIKSKMNGLVMDISGNAKSGHKVKTWAQHGEDNQVWYDDDVTGTIRSKGANGTLCLDLDGDELIVKEYKYGDLNQQWKRDGDYIRSRVDQSRVLDIYGENKEQGAKIGPYKDKGQSNQKWTFEFVGGLPAPPAAQQMGGPREFYIASEMHGMVLDVAGEKTDPGAKICMWEKHPETKKNQLWYIDSSGYIRSALNDMTISNNANGEQLVTAVVCGNPRSRWFFSGKAITSRAGECLDIRKADKDKGAKVISYEYKEQENQHWRREFA